MKTWRNWSHSSMPLVGACVLASIGALASSVHAAQGSDADCERLRKLIRETYTFRPSNLTHEQQLKKVEQMDRVWKLVETHKDLAPCLKTALEDANADGWFRLDGSALLAKVDPSKESKTLQARYWCGADFLDVDLAEWVPLLAKLGSEGIDVSEAGRRWLAQPELSYDVPAHSLSVGALAGALFLFGSMDEAQATPALVKIASDAKHPGRDTAIQVLALQATEESLRALAHVDLAGVSETTTKRVRELLAQPDLLQRTGAKHGLTRDKLLKAFTAFIGGKNDLLSQTQDAPGNGSVDDWPQQVLGLLKAEDAALLRKVRRVRMTYQSDEALDDYVMYSSILMAMTWTPDAVK